MKTQIASLVVNGLQSNITIEGKQVPLGVYILVQKYNGASDESLIEPIYQIAPVSPELAQAYADAATAKANMKAAWKETHPKTKQLGKVAQTVNSAGRKTFDPSAAKDAMEIADDEI